MVRRLLLVSLRATTGAIHNKWIVMLGKFVTRIRQAALGIHQRASIRAASRAHDAAVTLGATPGHRSKQAPVIKDASSVATSVATSAKRKGEVLGVQGLPLFVAAAELLPEAEQDVRLPLNLHCV